MSSETRNIGEVQATEIGNHCRGPGDFLRGFVVNHRLSLNKIDPETFASLKLFAEDGTVVFCCCNLSEACNHPLEFYTKGSKTLIASLVIHELRSIWK